MISPEMDTQQRAQQVREDARTLFVSKRNREPQFGDRVNIRFGKRADENFTVILSTGEVFYEGAPRYATPEHTDTIWVRHGSEILERITR